MLTYIVSGSNNWTLRTKTTQPTNQFTMSLQNMTTQINTTASLSGVSYNQYESLLSFTASIESASIAAEYRASISDGYNDIWFGSVQMYHSMSLQGIDKSDYVTQNDQYKSNVSDNTYIIMQ